MQLAHDRWLGYRHLSERSALIRRLRDLPVPKRIVIIDDTAREAEHLAKAIFIAYGAPCNIGVFRAIAEALEDIRVHVPSLVFLDDRLPPQGTAEASIPALRAAGYAGPLIVVSGFVTPSRQALLVRLGARDVVHKDDVESARIAHALLKVLVDDPPAD